MEREARNEDLERIARFPPEAGMRPYHKHNYQEASFQHLFSFSCIFFYGIERAPRKGDARKSTLIEEFV